MQTAAISCIVKIYRWFEYFAAERDRLGFFVGQVNPFRVVVQTLEDNTLFSAFLR